MIQAKLNLDQPLYTTRDLSVRLVIEYERMRMWIKQGTMTIDAEKVGRGREQKYTFLDVLRIAMVAYLSHYSLPKETAGQFADFLANRVRGRQKSGNLFDWQEHLLLDEDVFDQAPSEMTMDEELGMLCWNTWGIKAGSLAEISKEIHRENASVVRDRPVAMEDDKIVYEEASEEELDKPLTDRDYRILANEVLLPRRIIIIPIGQFVNSIALHFQPEAFE